MPVRTVLLNYLTTVEFREEHLPSLAGLLPNRW